MASILAQQLRLGLVQTDWIRITSATRLYRFTFTIPEPDFSDPSKSLDYTLNLSPNSDGSGAIQLFGGKWIGNAYLGKDGLPGLGPTLTVGPLPQGQYVQITVNFPVQMVCGATVDIL